MARGIISQVLEEHSPPLNTNAALSNAQDAMGYAQNEAASLKSSLDDIKQQMLDLLKDFDPATIKTQLDKIDYDKPGFPAGKQFAALVLNTSWPQGVPIKPTMEDFGNIDWSFIEPIPPEMLEKYFLFTAREYTSSVRPTLIASFLQNIESGGNGLTVQAHDAILGKERNARLNNQATTLRDALHATGANGFRVAGKDGSASAVVAEIFKTQVHSDQDALNTITAQDYEYSVRASEFFHNFGLEIERLLYGEWGDTENRRFEAAKAEFEFASAAVELNLGVYRERWQGIIAKTEAAKARIEAIASLNTNKTDQYVAEWDGHKSNVEAVGAENSAKLSQRQLEIQTEQMGVELVATQRQENRADAQFDLSQGLAELDAELKVYGLNLDGYKAGADLKNSVLSTLAQIIAQVVASTIGIMNTSASVGFSGSQGESHNVSESASVGESYSGEI